jgi:hypothetical protein
VGRRGMGEPVEGAELLLSLARADGSRASILLGAGEAVALAGKLIRAARLRMGRVFMGAGNSDSAIVSAALCRVRRRRPRQARRRVPDRQQGE